MALVESLDIPLGTPLIPFLLKDPMGHAWQSKELLGAKGTLVVFTCNHCPYALAVWPRLIRLARDAKKLGVHTVAINPNIHPSYPEDAPEVMLTKIKEWGIDFPYLVDESQDVAKAYKAQCTPDPYLFDAQHRLVYHGRMDDNWKDEKLVNQQELRTAIENLVNGASITTDQKPAMGCSIKWRP